MIVCGEFLEIAGHAADQINALMREGWTAPFTVRMTGAADEPIFWIVLNAKGQCLDSAPDDPVENADFPVEVSITDKNGRHVKVTIERVAPQ